MKEVKAIIEPSAVRNVLEALEEIPGLSDVVLSEVEGCGTSASGAGSTECVKQTSLEIVVPNWIVTEVVDAIARAAYSEGRHDGRIVVTSVVGVADIRDIESESRNEDS